MEISALHIAATAEPVAEMDRLGDEIAELSAHLEAATARLLDLIREFDARGGWNHGFRSCAHWLAWRIRVDLRAARRGGGAGKAGGRARRGGGAGRPPGPRPASPPFATPAVPCMCMRTKTAWSS